MNEIRDKVCMYGQLDLEDVKHRLYLNSKKILDRSKVCPYIFLHHKSNCTSTKIIRTFKKPSSFFQSRGMLRMHEIKSYVPYFMFHFVFYDSEKIISEWYIPHRH